MKIQTKCLTGIALDWAVAVALGGTDFYYDTVGTYWITLEGKDRALRKGWAQSFTPSTDREQGGLISEEEGINIFRYHKLDENAPWVWCAHKVVPRRDEDGFEYSAALTLDGPTPLVAAMRCLVAIKLGDEIEVPDVLFNGQ